MTLILSVYAIQHTLVELR